MPKLLDISLFCDDLKEVTTSKIMDKRKFHPLGLFSEQIFGPIKNYTCQCGTYHGISRSGGTCETCGIDIVNSNVRRKRFAKIILPVHIVNPIMYDLIIDVSDTTIKSFLNKLMKSDKCSLFRKDGYFYVAEDSKIPPDVEKWEKTEAIYELINSESIRYTENDPNSKWKIIKDNIDKLFIQNILVLPPDLRPAAKGIERNNQIVDEINRYYMQILTKKESMKDTIIDISRDKVLFYSYFKQIQKDAIELYEHIIEKLSKKEGLIRGNILGKRIDFSGRAVIIPDPSLKIDECSLPYIMFLELFKLQISKKLIEFSKFKLLNEAIDYIDYCILIDDFSLFNICEELSKNELCILNRQPSLHRLSMLGFKIKISKDSVIKLHPLACSGFNADFDGDQMAVYIPISQKTKDEILDKVIITKNFTNPANMSLSSVPSQDIVLGIYTLSTNQFPKLQNLVEYKNVNVPESIKILNECFPDDYHLINSPIGKKELIKILNDIKENYSDKITAETLDKIKVAGFKYSTIFGPTLSLQSFAIENYEEIRDSIYKDGSVIDQLKRLNSKETIDFLKENFKYSYLIESGSRGSWEQVKQIAFSRGFVSDFNGMIKQTPIKHSLLEGLNQEEFFNSTYGCRKGLLDVALNTGASGYLSRKLLFTGTNLEISKELDDCGTEDYLDVYVKDDKKSKMLLERYFLNDSNVLEKITKENRKSLLGKTIKLRSPIFCKSEHLCHKCYGDLYKLLHSQFVGVIAAQSLGETNTQLILRVFHNSGIAKLDKNNEESSKQKDIVGDLTLASRLFHQTKGKNFNDLVSDSYEIYNNSRDIHHVHFECIISQMMWGIENGNETLWRLLENRKTIKPTYYSIQTVPEKSSWLLGLGFSNPKRQIIKGIQKSGRYTGIFDRIICGGTP